MSATTIEVPLFLQPVAYDPATAPPLPDCSQSPTPSSHSSVHSLPEPSRIPPPPPRKIPLDNIDTPSSPMAPQQRPLYDPQDSYDGSERRSPVKTRRPRFDPQDSHGIVNSSHQRQRSQDQLSIPPPTFTNFSVESALPPIQARDEPTFALRQTPSLTTLSKAVRERDLYHEHLHQSSMSPVGSGSTDRWTTGLKAWQQQAAYAPTPEQQHVNMVTNDGRSISTTDLSSNTAGKSTPESQQTSNTSYREGEHQVNQPRASQEGDGSFYWHSGRSSSEVGGSQGQGASPTATPGEKSSTSASSVQPRETQNIPPRSTSLSPVISVPYGASALGFGGPSDWEYFGDYEAEEIDDEELYSRPRAQTSSVEDRSAELPAISAPSRDEERLARDHWDGQPAPELSSAKQVGVTPGRGNIVGDTEFAVKRGNSFERDAVSRRLQEPDHVQSTQIPATSNPSPDIRPDLDDIIRAWSEAPYVGLVSNEAQSSMENDNSRMEPSDVPEASLASTPREKMFGADFTLKNAPSLPKLPVDLDKSYTHEHRSEKEEEISTATVEPPLASERAEEYMSADSAQSHPSSANGMRINPFMTPSELSPTRDHARGRHSLHLSGSDKIDETPNAADVTSSNTSNSGALGLGISNESLDTDSIAKVKTEPSIVQPSTAALKAQVPIPKTIKNSSVLQRVKELEKKRSDSSFHDRSRDMTLDDSLQDHPRTSVVATPDPNHISLTDANSQHHTQHDLEEPMSKGAMPTTLLAAQESSQPTTPEIVRKLEDRKTALEISPEVLDGTALNQSVADKPRNDQNPVEPDPNKAEIKDLQISPEDSIPAESDHQSSQKDQLEEVTQVPVDHSADRPQHEATAPAKLSHETPIETPQDVYAPEHASTPIAGRTVNPYADLDAWGKASLNRFAAMLREESRAESNKDKLNIFNVFTSRESRLRVVLYGTEDDLIVPPKSAEQKPEAKPESHRDSRTRPTIGRTNTINLQRSLKALPALPANRESVIGLPTTALAPLVIENNQVSKTVMSGSALPPVGDSQRTAESPSDETQYSPGGRPIISHLSGGAPKGEPQTSENQPSSDTERNLGWASSSDQKAYGGTDPLHAYANTSEGRSEVKNYLAHRKSVVRPYVTLTHETFNRLSTFGKESDTRPALVPVMAPTSQYNLNSLVKDGASDLATREKAPATETPSEPRRFVKADFDPLLTVLPESAATVHESPRLADLKHVIEAVPDDFTFIHQCVVSWDAKAKKQREENDRQRHARQVESEQRIDSLFDDHEIGYGDISELEAEFKQSEAGRKADEDRSEYQTFVADVFNVVWTRLHYELDQLIPHYEQYSKLMNQTTAGKDMFEESEDGLPLAPTMSAFLGLHQKLEIRHQKAFEAVLERDRRLKKTEMTPWYTLSNIAKAKQLEKQFEDAEKKAIIEYCHQRDTRANQLMEVLDQNTLRGVGANQDYMEAIMKAVRRIASGRAFASVAGSNEPTAGLEEVEKAKAITAVLSTSSEQIVQTFHVADMLLNSADYEVSVARAKVDKADMATLAKLKEERAKEDQKLMRDLEHRLALIREDSRRTNDEIVKLMLFLGVQNGRASSTTQAGPADSEHEARIQKALEEAKIRNALKESSM